MAIHTLNLNRIMKLAIQFPASVHILLEMAINTVHPLLRMNVFQVNRLLRAATLIIGRRRADTRHGYYTIELVRCIPWNHVIVLIQEVSFAILLENGPEDPSMSMIIRKLCMRKLRVQLADSCQEFKIAPVPSQRGLFRIRGKNCKRF